MSPPSLRRATLERRRPVRSAAGVLVGALAWAAASVAGVTGAAAATIEGQAFDREGRSLPKISVTLVERLKDGHEQVVSSVATDPHGFFQFDTGPRSVKGKVIVRCGDPAQWDTVRYAPPAEVDVTRTLREKDRAIVSCIAEDAPQWPAVRREIEGDPSIVAVGINCLNESRFSDSTPCLAWCSTMSRNQAAGEVGIIGSVQTLFAHKTPQTFDQVQLR